MAAQAVAEVGEAFFGVFRLCFSAVVAGVASPPGQVGLVAVGAGIVYLAMIHREGMQAVEARRPPGGSGVTLRASLAGEQPQVIDRVGVAGGALPRGAFELLVFVAGGAFNIDVRAFQREGC